jgi:hypothetical protein
LIFRKKKWNMFTFVDIINLLLKHLNKTCLGRFQDWWRGKS